MTKNADCEVLGFIRYASRLRVKSIARLLKNNGLPSAFLYVIAAEQRSSRRTAARCSALLARRGLSSVRFDALFSAVRYLDATPGHDTAQSAKRLILSATAEVIGITRRLSASGGCTGPVAAFCEKVVDAQNEFMERLRGFL